MISITGNNTKSGFAGFTFVELLVTTVVLSVGLVFVYKSFFLCLDYLQSLASRWGAMHVINQRVDDLTFQMQTTRDFVIDPGEPRVFYRVHHKHIAYDIQVVLTPHQSVQGVYDVGVTAKWRDGRRGLTATRNVCLLR